MSMRLFSDTLVDNNASYQGLLSTDRLSENVMESMTNNILTTKLEVPSATGGILERQRLFKLLGNQTLKPLTLISAPAGFGKTTLMASWLDQHKVPTAWLSVDADDNDPVRFLVHIIATISRHIDGFGEAELGLFQAAQNPALQGLLPSLVNQLNANKQPLVLVLDDYHYIDQETVHEVLRFFLEHRPSHFYLALTSRTDPPLPLPRLRVRGQIAEIRENELRFIQQEAETLLNSVLQLELDAADISVLEKRTEGWIAGLQLAALSLQNSTDSAGFIQSFAGNDRYIMDYLTEEVLERQTEERREFLLQTSILERLSSKLCAAVTGIDNCNEILAGLENDHMFIVPLDNRREWYRYHHLFADLLATQLEFKYAPIINDLHNKASRWYAEHGYLNEAIRHALSAENYAQAAEMIELHGMDIFHQGRISTLLNWFNALPEDETCKNPKRLIIYAWALFTGTEQYVGPWLEKAEVLLESEYSDSYSVTDQDMIRGQIMILRGFMAMHEGETWQTIELIEHAQRYLTDESNSLSQTATKLLLGAAYLFTGQIDSAERTLKQAIEVSLQHNSLIAYVPAVCSLIRLRSRQGQLKQAILISEQAEKTLLEHGWSSMPDTAALYFIKGDMLHELSLFSDAKRAFQKSIDLISAESWHTMHSGIHYLRALLHITQGCYEKAAQDLETARDIDYCGQLFRFFPDAAYYNALIDFRLGNIAALEEWADNCNLDLGDDIDPRFESEYMLLARTYLARHQYDKALKLLSRILLEAERGKRFGVVIEASLLSALARQGLGQTKQALSSLDNALELAAPQGYVRLFVDEGPYLKALLQRLPDNHSHKDYIKLLLTAFPEAVSEQANNSNAGGLSEPLSPKELNTLRLLVSGLTNKEIAEKAFVSPNTVKTHIKKIYDKMEVNSRAQAINRARELELI